MNAGAHNEHLAYQPQSAADQVHVYSCDNVASARHVGSELNQSLPAAQPTRAASMRQTEMRYPSAGGGDMVPNVSVHSTVIPLSVPASSHLSNSSPLTRTTDVVQPDVPVSSLSTCQDAANHRSPRDSFDLPAPPTPPSSSLAPTSLSGDQLPSPPTMIAGVDFSYLPSQPYLPPPELLASPASDVKAIDQSAAWHKSDGSSVTSAAVDNSSDSSSLLTTQQADDVMKAEPPLVRDTRSDLLAAIREGMCSLRVAADVCHVILRLLLIMF